MKHVLAKVLSLLRSFFVSLKIHIHIGSKNGEINRNSNGNTTNEDSDDPELKE